MPVKISPIKILSDLGYEMVDIETDDDYLSALRESINTIEAATKGSGDKRSEALREELIRVRKERKAAAPSAGMKVTQKKISTSKFFGKKEQKSPAQGKGGAIIKIGNSVTSIVETLKEDQKQDKKQQGWFRKMVERVKRRKKENKLEFKVLDGIKKTATKLLAPFKSAWGQLLDFIGKVLLGRVLFKILEWMGNKENQGKLQSIIKFFKDWWPAMLAGYLLFGNAFTGFALGLLKNLVVWGAKLLSTVIPALMKAMAAMGPLGWGLLATGAVVGGGMYLANRNKNKEGEGDDTNVEATGDDTNVEATGDDTNVEATGDEEVQKMNKGGVVPGSGNTDTVPAMLTPGEFVMSKGAVQKYGADTLAGMNAAAGGTNKPKLGRYNEGGKVQTLSEKLGHTRGVMTDPEEIKQEKEYMLKFVNEERALQGLPPLQEVTVAPGVEFTKMMGPGPRTKEYISTEDDIIGGTRTKTRSKTVEGHGTKLSGEISQLTDEDREKFYAENPYMRTLVNIKDQVELDNLGADISASAKMNGGGLVQNFQGGGLVQGLKGGLNWIKKGTVENFNKIIPIKKKKVTVVYEEEKQNMTDKPNTEKSSQEIPSFNVTAMRSPEKIKLLGISV